jgi:hypothetical protein
MKNISSLFLDLKTTHHTLFSKSIYELSEDNFQELISEVGVTVLHPAYNIDSLLDSIIQESAEGMSVSPKIGAVYQHFTQKESFIDNNLFNFIKEKVEQDLSKSISKYTATPFEFVSDSVILQKYEYVESLQEYAMPPHVDQKGFVNLVPIILIKGSSKFLVFKNKEDKNPLEIPATPGDMILMRGYNFMDNTHRPVHGVAKILKNQERISLGFRQITKDEKDLEALKKAFNVEK